jgi:HD-like signal output (HDOD) protein
MFSFFKRHPQPEPVAPVQADEVPHADAVVDAVLMSGVVLPPYPAVLEEIDHLMARDDFELSRLVEQVARDPSLRAALLRVANSAVFGIREPVSDLLRAITVLGMERTRAVL